MLPWQIAVILGLVVLAVLAIEKLSTTSRKQALVPADKDRIDDEEMVAERLQRCSDVLRSGNNQAIAKLLAALEEAEELMTDESVHEEG